MKDKNIEQRSCFRFRIPGATVSYRTIRLLRKQQKFQEEFCPVLDISRGGIHFLTQNLLKFRSKVEVAVFVPGEVTPFYLKGKIIWCTFNPGKSYKYQVGLQFNPYGEEKNQNPPSVLLRLASLEEKFTNAENP